MSCRRIPCRPHPRSPRVLRCLVALVLTSAIGAGCAASSGTADDQKQRPGRVFGGLEEGAERYDMALDLWRPPRSPVAEPALTQACTGVLLHPRLMLTTADCVDDELAEPGDYRVRPPALAVDPAAVVAWTREAPETVVGLLQERADELGGPGLYRDAQERIMGMERLTEADLAHVAGVRVRAEGWSVEAIEVFPGYRDDPERGAGLALVRLEDHGEPLRTVDLGPSARDDELLVLAGHGTRDDPGLPLWAPRPLRWSLSVARVYDLAAVAPEADPRTHFATVYDPARKDAPEGYGPACHAEAGSPVLRDTGGTIQLVGVSRGATGLVGTCRPEEPHTSLHAHLEEPALKEWIATRAKAWALTQPFDDIAGDIYEREIRRAHADGLVSGFEDGTFRPRLALTREASVVLGLELMQRVSDGYYPMASQVTESPFHDVAADRWSAPALAYAAELGLVDGYEDGRFRPDATMTRGELVAFLSRVAEQLSLDLRQERELPLDDEAARFRDVDAHWARPAVERMAGFCGVASAHFEHGRSFAPDYAATRGYATAAFVRLAGCFEPLLADEAELPFDGPS